MHRKHSIDDLLREARCITMEQLEEARLRSESNSIPIGRTLVLMGAIKTTQLAMATDLQRMVQTGRVSFYEAVQELQTASSRFGARYFVGRQKKAEQKGTIRVGELLTLSGVVAESHLLEALETSFANGTSVGEALVKLGLVSESMLEKTLNFQEQVNRGDVTKEVAISELRWMRRANSLLTETANAKAESDARRLAGS
jgi:hypothetical protein